MRSGLLAVQAAWLDRRLDVGERRVADRLPRLEALAQPQERDVAVAVVGRLRQDGEDQLVDRPAVRRRERDAVDLPQAVAQRAHPPRRRPRPLAAGHGRDLHPGGL